MVALSKPRSEASANRQPSDVDAAIGAAIRSRRTIIGVPQEVLAHELAVSVQQLCKYESGINRVSASRLLKIASILRTDVTWFLLDRHIQPQTEPETVTPVDSNNAPDPLATLVRAYMEIESEHARSLLIALAQQLVGKTDRKTDRPQ